MNLSTPVEQIPRVGPQYSKKLNKLGIKIVEDLLFHFPHRYEDFSNLTKIAEVKVGETASIRGKILKIKTIRTWKKRMSLTEAIVEDDSGAIKVVWFNQPYLSTTLKEGDFLGLAGKVVIKEKGIYLSNPVYERITDWKLRNGNYNLTHTGRLVPIYPETQGLTSRWLRFMIKPLLFKFKNTIQEYLPERIRNGYNLLELKKALWQIHFPDSIKSSKEARNRFAFEELFNLSFLALRERQRVLKEKAVPISIDLNLVREFVDGLPFELTQSQKKSSWEILKDLEKNHPMNRLLEGDVGSGKTVVAAISVINTANKGYQTAFMAPTEILAQQHFKTFKWLFGKTTIRMAMLTSKESKTGTEKVSKKEILEKLKQGEIDFIIGTHSLIQEDVKFSKLAFTIVDEQHKFGVEQRAKITKNSGMKNFTPHLLSMTATPIPRTLALTIYGDLDLSLITEMPKGRKKVITEIIPPEERQKTYDFIKKEVKNKKQVFVICPRIESGQTEENMDLKNKTWNDVKAVKAEYEKLSKEVFPKLKISMLHGRMRPEEKEKIMTNFKNGKSNILVSTSVVEVGVDIPNATVMMIEGAEKFGLAQLHQFRGRAGRSEHQAFCFLFTESFSKKVNMRLKALLTAENGFELAEKDLEIRGPGDFSGARQWGIPDLAMASLKDIFLVNSARQAAKEILEEDPELKKYPLLKQRINYFNEKIHLE